MDNSGNALFLLSEEKIKESLTFNNKKIEEIKEEIKEMEDKKEDLLKSIETLSNNNTVKEEIKKIDEIILEKENNLIEIEDKVNNLKNEIENRNNEKVNEEIKTEEFINPIDEEKVEDIEEINISEDIKDEEKAVNRKQRKIEHKKSIDLKKIFSKENIIPFTSGIIIGSFIFGGFSSSGYKKELSIKEQEITSKNQEIADKEAQIKEKNDEIDVLQAKVDEASPWFKMTEAEKIKKEEELRKQEEARKEAERKKEEEELRKQEEEAKKGYDTGISYSQLARTPDEYMGKKVKFSGKVLQTVEDSSSSVTIRLAVDGDYDNVILGVYDSSIVSERILEDDYITIYGLSAGIFTYESTMGANISIPSISIDKISR